MNRNTIRKFVCKRCGKDAKDLQGGFKQFSEKHQVELEYENIDLCDKCFKKTVQEEKNVKYLQEAMSQGLFKEGDDEHFKRFQTDKYFKRAVLENLGIIKTDNPIDLGRWGLQK